MPMAPPFPPTIRSIQATHPPAEKKARVKLSDHDKKKLLFYYFSNGSALTLKTYCKTQNISNAVYQQLQKTINKHPVLKDMLDKMGEVATRNDALSYINMNFPGPSVVPKSPIPKQQDFFTVKNIHEVASNLDFEEEPRMSRNGKKEIPIHDRHDMDERTRSLTISMIQMVIANTPHITRDTEEQVSVDAGTIIMYDQGYRTSRGTSTTRSTWMPRLIKYLEEGVADGQAPLESGSRHRNMKKSSTLE